MSKLIPSSDPILHTPTQNVNFEKEWNLIQELFDIMIKNNGIGIAAPQIGECKNIFLAWDIKSKAVLRFINSKIIEVSKETCLMTEGCLSFPNLIFEVERPKSIVIEYLNPFLSKKVTEKFSGLTARIIQHEYDHVMGITFDQRGRIVNEISS